MKKILVVCAAITLSCFLVRAQEAENTGSGAGLSVISRLDAGLNFDSREGTFFNFGNTSLYTLFEGNISENWSFSVANHWLASDWTSAGFLDGLLAPTELLYVNTLNYPFSGHSGNSIFDWAYVTYNMGSWEFSGGKMPLLVGGFEFDEYDFDVNPITTSTFWNSFTVYQYGVSAAWTSQDEAHTVTLQLASDQNNTRPAFAVKWNGDLFGFWSTNYSLLIEQYYNLTRKAYSIIPVLSLGNRFTYNNFTLTADYISRAGDPLYNFPDIEGYTFLTTLGYTFDETLDVSLRYCHEKFAERIPDEEGNLVYYYKDLWGNLSAQANWYPIENLRVQGCAGIRTGMPYIMAGATYTFDFKLW